MAKRKAKLAEQAELPTDRCPNCGGPLKFPEHWKEGLCAKCGIFVEILLPSPAERGAEKEPKVRDVASRRETAKFYLASEELLEDQEEGAAPVEPVTAEESSEPSSAGEAEASAPAPEPAVVVEPEAALTETPAPSPPEAPSSEAKPAVEAPPAVEPTSTPENQAPVEATPEPESPSTEEPSAEPAPSVAAAPESPPQPAVEPEPPAPEPEPPEPPEPEDQDFPQGERNQEEPPIAEAETIIEPEREIVEEPEGATEPGVEAEPAFQPPEPQYEVVEGEPFVSAQATPVAQARAAAARRTPLQPRPRDRALLYVGSVLVAFGGSGLILGSLLHDMFRVPLFGHSYETFGPLNMTAAMFGAILALAGMAAIGASLRGGIVKVRKAARA